MADHELHLSVEKGGRLHRVVLGGPNSKPGGKLEAVAGSEARNYLFIRASIEHHRLLDDMSPAPVPQRHQWEKWHNHAVPDDWDLVSNYGVAVPALQLSDDWACPEPQPHDIVATRWGAHLFLKSREAANEIAYGGFELDSPKLKMLIPAVADSSQLATNTIDAYERKAPFVFAYHGRVWKGVSGSLLYDANTDAARALQHMFGPTFANGSPRPSRSNYSVPGGAQPLEVIFADVHRQLKKGETRAQQQGDTASVHLLEQMLGLSDG